LGKLQNKTILITGGAGMLGSTLALMADAAGARIRILDAMLPMYGGNQFNLMPIRDRVEFILGDIRDPETVRSAVQDVDYVFDLAAQVSYVHSNQDPLLDVDINCRGHIVVLEACRRISPKAKLIFTSSRFVYGQTEYNPVDEGHPANCRSIYGIHKLTAEKYFQFYHDAFGLQTASVRIANPYGPRQQMHHNSYGIVNWFVRLAMDGKPLTIYGDGHQARDYVFVDDIASGMLAVATAENTNGRTFNLGSGVGTRFCDMAETVRRFIPGTEIHRVPWPKDRYFVETGDYISDLSRIRHLTEWTPTVNFEEGIRKTIDFYKEYKEHYWTVAKLAMVGA
jgi:UDP-glucose 4-epimerase